MAVKLVANVLARSLNQLKLPQRREQKLIACLKKSGVIDPGKYYASLSDIRDSHVKELDPERLAGALEMFNGIHRDECRLFFFPEDNTLGFGEKNVRALLIKAEVLFEKFRLTESVSVLETVLELESENSEAKMRLGMTLERQGNYLASCGKQREAYLCYSESLRAAPENRNVKNFRLAVAGKIGEAALIREASLAVLKSRHDDRALDLFVLSTERLAPELLSAGKLDETLCVAREFVLRDRRELSQAKKSLFNILLAAARHLRVLGEPKKAFSCLNEASLLGESVELIKEKAFVLYELKDHEGAYEFFDLLLQISDAGAPRDVNALIAFGMTCLEVGRTRRADQLFDLALKLDRFNNIAVLGKGRALFLMGNFTAAASFLSRVKRAYPEAGQILFQCRNLAPLLKLGVQIKREDILRLKPDELRALASVFKRERLWDKARIAYDRIIELFPSDPEGLYGAAVALYKIGRKMEEGGRREAAVSLWREAEEKVRVFVTIEPGHLRAFSLLVLLLKKQDRKFELMSLLDERTRKNPSSEAFVQAASILKAAGETAHSKGYLERALELDENNHFARLKLIDLIVFEDKKRNGGRGLLNEALIHCEEGIAIAPRMINYHYEKGSIYLIMKKYREALDILLPLDQMIERIESKSVETLTKRLWTRIRIADTYLDLGKLDECSRWLDAAERTLPLVPEDEANKAGGTIARIDAKLLAQARTS